MTAGGTNVLTCGPDYPSNPFCTRRVKPGAMPYLFPPGEDIARLVDRLAADGWRGQILGPHGSGKSCLLATLADEIPRYRREPVQIRIGFRQGWLPGGVWAVLRAARPGAGVLLVDGYEQLNFWARFRLRRGCRQRSLGLVVTAHRRLGLPVLYRTGVTAEAAERVFRHLIPTGTAVPVTTDDLHQRLGRTTNFREVLFDLYDLYERRIREPPGGPAAGGDSGAAAGR